MSSIEQLQTLAKYILPEEIFAYFDIVNIEESTNVLHIYLDEQPDIPQEYQTLLLESKGFYPEAEICDFPLRDKKVILHVRRRRWLNTSTGGSVSREWKLTAEGTRYTEGFATFLKGLLGFIPDYGPLS
jgi:hypothetical protein